MALRKGEPVMPSVAPTDEQCHVPSETTKMYLRLAFLNKQEIEKTKKTPSKLLIRKSSMKPCLTAGWARRPRLRPECPGRLSLNLGASGSM